MIKGAQKQMIVVSTGDSRYFDEAYFVIRREVKAASCRRDMLREANRILEESSYAEEKPRKRRGWLLFFAGILCGGVPTALIFLLLL